MCPLRRVLWRVNSVKNTTQALSLLRGDGPPVHVVGPSHSEVGDFGYDVGDFRYELAEICCEFATRSYEVGDFGYEVGNSSLRGR